MGLRALGLDLDQQGEKLNRAPQWQAGRLGTSVALPGDGDIALAGSPDNDGAWKFVRSGGASSRESDVETVCPAAPSASPSPSQATATPRYR